MRSTAMALCAGPLLLLASCTSTTIGAPDGRAEAMAQMRVAQDPAAMLRIAGAAEQAGDIAGASAFYRRAADLGAPDSAAAQIGVARTLAEQDRTEEAIVMLRTAHAQSPDNALISATLGRLLIAAHRPDQALALFREALARSPRTVSLLIGQGVAFDARSQHAAAAQSYDAALAIDPDNVAARNDLALSMTLAGDTERGAAMLRALVPGADTTDRATVEGNLALVYGLAGDTAAAQAAARLAMPEQDVANNLLFYAAMRGQGSAGRGSQDGGSQAPDGGGQGESSGLAASPAAAGAPPLAAGVPAAGSDGSAVALGAPPP